MFSCGVIFYVVMTGRPLFRGSTAKEMLDKNRKCEFTLNEQPWQAASESARDLCLKLLKVDPNERLSAKDALQHPWFTEATGQAKKNSQVVCADLVEKNQQMKNLIMSNDQVASHTPVVGGIQRMELVPETSHTMQSSDG